MRPCNRRDRFQTAHDGPVLRRSVRIGGLPVDWRAIEDRARQLRQRETPLPLTLHLLGEVNESPLGRLAGGIGSQLFQRKRKLVVSQP